MFIHKFPVPIQGLIYHYVCAMKLNSFLWTELISLNSQWTENPLEMSPPLWKPHLKVIDNGYIQSHRFSLSCVSKLTNYLNSDRNTYSIYHTKLHHRFHISHSISSIPPLFWPLLDINGITWMALSSSIKERQFIESPDRWQGLEWPSGLWRFVMDKIFERNEFWKMLHPLCPRGYVWDNNSISLRAFVFGIRRVL